MRIKSAMTAWGTLRMKWGPIIVKIQGFTRSNGYGSAILVWFSVVIFFFLFFTFRMAGYLDFNAPNAPSHASQHTVVHFGLLWFYLLAHKLLTKMFAITPFWTSFCIDWYGYSQKRIVQWKKRALWICIFRKFVLIN